MKSENDPHYWQDAVFKPMWIVHNGKPARQLLCIKNAGKGKKARMWTSWNGGGWVYFQQKHVDWFLTLEACEQSIVDSQALADAEHLVQIEKFHLAQGRSHFRQLARLKYKDLPTVPEDAARAARQLILNQREIRKSK